MYISKKQLQEIMSILNLIHYKNWQEEPLYFHVFAVWLMLMYAISIRII